MEKGPEDEPKVIGKFALGILLCKYSDGKAEFRFQSKNENIPIEIILTQVKAWLRNQENIYFDNFDKHTSHRQGDFPDEDEK